jgi:ATP-dependent Zn protease
MQLGMSENVGLVTFSRQRGSFLQPGEALQQREYSEATAQTIDSEVRTLLANGYQRAHEILTRDRKFLEAIARKLLDTEVMDRAELRELLGLAPEQPGDSSRPEIGHVPDAAAD